MRVHLDPGHYGSAYNHGVYGGYVESNFTWQIANKLKSELEKRGVEVTLSRYNKDENPALTTRGGGSKDKDLFISLHSNACSTPSVRRVVVIKPLNATTRASQFAQGIGDLVTETMGITEKTSVYTKESESTKGVDYYGVIRGAVAVGQEMAFILEHSFHTNAETCKWLLDEANVNQLAVKEAEYICDFFGVKEEEPVKKGTILNDEAFKDELVRILKTKSITNALKTVICAQGILESGWGKSAVAQGFNIFGLKWFGDEYTKNYRYKEYPTKEWDGTKYIEIQSKFCDFDSYEQAVDCIIHWYDRPKYTGIKTETDYYKCIEMLIGKYATSPVYGESLNRVITQYNLADYFKEETQKPVEPTKTHFYRVVCGSFTQLKFAQARQAELKAKGYDTFLFDFTLNGTLYKRVVVGSFTSKANAQARQTELKKIGYDTFLFEIDIETAEAKKSNLEIAREVYAGKWGNGQERKTRLEAAGYNYSDVQSLVNELVHGLIK